MIKYITEEMLTSYAEWLREEEKSPVTVEKYLRDLERFRLFLGSGALGKEEAIAFKQHLVGEGYAPSSVNSMLSSVNHFLEYCGRQDCRVKTLRVQRRAYVPEERELTKGDYRRLLEASRKDTQMNLLLQTLCATGIRVSELRYFTVEALEKGKIEVNCKNKSRTIFVPSRLRGDLLRYARKKRIRSGPIFVTRNGACLDRSNIWTKMKKLCGEARIDPKKAYPHNLRKLFARTFYGMDKDIAKLADILGHSSIDTTRIYIMTTGEEHRKQIEHMGLLMDGVSR